MEFDQAQEIFISTWHELSQRLGFNEAESTRVQADLLAAYKSPSRHYHGVEHIANLITLAKQHCSPSMNLDNFLLAIYFHDYIYEISREKLPESNERQSASHAETALTKLGLAAERIARIKQFIIATEKHQDSGDREINFFLDLDLSVLAGTRHNYELYSRGIKREYTQGHIYSEKEYNAGRIALFLEPMLKRSKIFLTDIFPEGDVKAKENIAHELETLKQRQL